MILMNVGKLRLKSKKKKLQLQSLTTVIPVLRTQKGMLVWFWPRRALCEMTNICENIMSIIFSIQPKVL